MWSFVPAHVVMQYVDDELPWFWRILVRAGIILSPRLRHRVHSWRRFATKMGALLDDSEPGAAGVPVRLRGRAPEPSS